MKKIKSGVYIHQGEELLMRWYKEPMTQLTKSEGFGFKGALLQTLNGEKLLCSVCGGLFVNLGFHIHSAHKLKAKEYKERFGLAYGTSLVSDTLRMHLQTKTIEWLNTLSDEDKQAYKDKRKKPWPNWKEPGHNLSNN